MILSCLLAFPQLVPPANTPLYDWKETSRPEFAVVSAPSANGLYVFQASGTELIVLDALGLQACANAGGGGPSCDVDSLNAGLSRTRVDASILDIEELGQNVYIAGGDYGLIVLGPAGGNGYVNGYNEIFRDESYPAGSITGRWCMDVSVKNGAVVAVFSGLDDSELRVYSAANPPVLQHIYSLGLIQGIPSPSMAFAVEYSSNRAYIAMGRAGVYAVDTTKDPATSPSTWLLPGPLGTGDTACTSSTPNSRFVGDLALVSVGVTQRYLYAAADSWGLVEIDLGSQAWGTTMNFWYSNPPCYWDALPVRNCSNGVSLYHYAEHVDAVLDPSNDQVVIALTSTTQSPEGNHLLAPYTTYGTLRWDLKAPLTGGPPSQNACTDLYHLFTRTASSPGTPPSESVAAQHHPLFHFPTPVYLMKDAPGNHAWLLDAALYVVHYQRTAGSLQKVGVLAGGLHLPVSSPMYPLPALNNPDVVLVGDDGIGGVESVGLYEIQPIVGGVDFVEIPPPLSEPGLFQINIAGTAQWIDSAFPATHEFFLRGKGSVEQPNQPPSLNLWRLDASSPATLQSLKRNGVKWEVDPSSQSRWTFKEGRGYSSTAVDDRQGSNLVVETRSQAIHGAWLFDREELRFLVSQAADEAVIVPTNFAPLLSHPEADPVEYDDQVQRTFTMHPLFFDINVGGPVKRVLGMAAGFSVDPGDSATFEHAQVMFHDVTNVLTPSQLSVTPSSRRIHSNAVVPATAVCLDAATVRLNDPANPGQKKRRTLAFVGGTEGLLTVFDVSQGLFTGAPIPETPFPLPTDMFDGHADVVMQLDFQPSVSGNRVGYLHVGAIRLGMVRYTVQDNGNGGVTLIFDGGFNTPGSFGGFYIDTVNDKERLIVADHFFYGLRAYGDY
jgi:hypothetical protein